MALSHIVPQRTDYDCLPAALATVMGWTYERARDVLGPHTYERGTFLLPLTTALLPEGIAGSYLLSRENPLLSSGAMASHWGQMLASPAEIRRLIQGRRAIVVVPGLGPGNVTGPEFYHAIAWDGSRAIHCGAIGDDPGPSGEVDLVAVPPLEALILSEVTGTAAKPAQTDEAAIDEGTDIAGIFERHAHVVLGFSGGKESIALAHAVEPWRDRVTLVWANTGFMAAHMVDFVRAYGERFNLVELASPSLPDVWAIDGVPADVAPFANVAGTAAPRFQPWLRCCFTMRQAPVNAYLREIGPCCYMNGQRAADHGGATFQGLRSSLPASVTVAMPLTHWSEADVYAYIERHGLTLPPQYADGYPDSIECTVCPAEVWPKRMAYLERHYPEALPTVRAAVRSAANETMGTVAHMLATVEAPALSDAPAQEIA